jgi:hypothetical protein
MGEPRDPSELATQTTTITVGGSSGIRVEGAGVTVGGVFVSHPHTGAPAPVPPQPPAMGLAAFTHGASLVAGHPRAAGALLVAGGAIAATTSAVFIALLQLSWVLMLLPSVPVAACLVGGGILLARGAPRGGPAATDEVERRLLAFAMAQGGQVTVTGAAVALGISLAAADEALMRLVRSGHVTAENDASTGAVIYVFPDIQAGLGDRPRRLP